MKFRTTALLSLVIATVTLLPSELVFADGVLVFGGTGRLGSESVKQLIGTGEKITVFARPSSDRSRLDDLDVAFVTGDMLNEEDMLAAFQTVKPSIVVDASALYGDDHEQAVRNIVAGAKASGVKQIIHHGSVGAGDNMKLFPHIDFTELKATLLDKGRAEQILIDSGLNYTIIRNGLLENDDSVSTGKARMTEDPTALGRITRRDLAAVTMDCFAAPQCANKIFHALDDNLPVRLPGQDSETRSDTVELSSRRGLQEMVVSVKFLDRAIDLYKEIADWEVAYRGLAPADQAMHWGLPKDTVVEQAVLRVPGTAKGYLRLVKFVGVEQQRIRSSARPFDTGAIFNFNALVKDLEGVFEAMRDNGFVGFADPTYYTIFGKRYGGAMLRGHDGVVINLLLRVNDPYEDIPPFTKMSHVVNATQMVDDYDESMEFFRDKLGWHLRWEAAPQWPADGANNMGLPNNLLLEGKVKERAASFIFAPDADGGSIEIFHFEGVSGADFSARAHPPNLGVLMYRVHVPDLETYAAMLASNGVKTLRPMTALDVAPYGQVKSLIIAAPSGAWIEFFEQRPAD